MAEAIKDGVGKGNLAKVDEYNRLRSYSTTESEISYESETHARAYTWTHSYNSGANDTILWLKNTSTTSSLIIDTIILASDTTTHFVIHFPSTTASPTGTGVTGTNLNRTTNNVAQATCYGDETGNSQGVVMAQGIILNNAPAILPVNGSIVLGINNELGIDFVSATTALGMATIRGYYHEI